MCPEATKILRLSYPEALQCLFTLTEGEVKVKNVDIVDGFHELHEDVEVVLGIQQLGEGDIEGAEFRMVAGSS